MLRHTGGNWRMRRRNAAFGAKGRPTGGWNIYQEGDRDRPCTIAYLQSHPLLPAEVGEANALLMASSPKLLASLREIDVALGCADVLGPTPREFRNSILEAASEGRDLVRFLDAEWVYSDD